ncbi:MAG: maleylpyruvate isomerase N-terminal domain-containing protein [Anaerolineaceae bacterium]
MREDLLAAIEGFDDAAMIEPSLDGWSVKDHLAHLALWDEIRVSELVRISAGHQSAWRTAGAQDAVYNELGHALRLSHSLAQARWELDHTRQALLEAIAAATPRGVEPSLYGEAGLRSNHETQHTVWLKRHRDAVLGRG